MTDSNPSPSILHNNTSNKAPQKKSVKLPVLRPSPAGVRKPAARHSTPNQEPLPSTRQAVQGEMKPENSYQSPYAYLAPSQQPDTRSAAAPAVASPPVTPGVSAHPAAADLIRADERLKIREELLGRGYKLPSGLLRAREQTPGTKIEDQEDEQNSRNLTPDQKLRRAELSVEIEEEKEKLGALQAEVDAAKATLAAAGKVLRQAKDRLREAKGKVDKLSKRYHAV
ncbi:hypothetical protein BO99DRAFT_450349 [Aspergillus violaceofuscus CBS 115571]|uniref:Uncharacterized protein n=1 Tax=Aspergillus violaceofuscus (strain CBS 115571) TaxID=1450538 RepID=A0A2V5HEP1_ASPV1|nr:hypothetical protein BO99DRAFT_450349 [Aspergillus violaceofuscus CBS 115571]